MSPLFNPRKLFFVPLNVDGINSELLSREWDHTLYRATQHYGFKYHYTERTVEQTKPLIQQLQILANKLFGDGIFIQSPNQVIVNEYLPGQGIYAHRDSSCFGETIASLSLGGAASMHFIKIQEAEVVEEDLQLLLLPRSLLVSIARSSNSLATVH